MNTVGIRVNTRTKAVSQYAGLGYNSLAVMSDLLLGADTTGIAKLTQDAAVTAYFETKHFDFDIPRAKRVRTVYLTGQFKGGMSVTSVIDGIDCEVVTINPEYTLTEKTYVVNFSADHIGRFVGFKIANTNGADFSVDKIDVLFTVTASKWVEVYLLGRIKGEVPNLTISATGV